MGVQGTILESPEKAYKEGKYVKFIYYSKCYSGRSHDKNDEQVEENSKATAQLVDNEANEETAKDLAHSEKHHRTH